MGEPTDQQPLSSCSLACGIAGRVGYLSSGTPGRLLRSQHRRQSSGPPRALDPLPVRCEADLLRCPEGMKLRCPEGLKV